MSTKKTLDQLLLGYFTDSLTAPEAARLDRLLLGSPEAMSRFIETVQHDMELREVFTIGKTTGTALPRVSAATESRSAVAWLRKIAPLASAAAIMLAIGGLLWLSGGSDAARKSAPGLADAGDARTGAPGAEDGLHSARLPMLAYASAVDLGTAVRRPGSDVWHPLSEGGGLVAGSAIRTSRASSATVTYAADATRIRVLPNTTLELRVSGQGGKLVLMDKGSVECDADKQPKGRPLLVRTPQADLKIVGTRFKLGATDSQTRLDVAEGLVMMSKRDETEFVEVAAGDTCIANKREDRLSLWGPVVFDEDFKSDASNWVVVVGDDKKVYEVADPEVSELVKFVTRQVDGEEVAGLLIDSAKAKDKLANLVCKSMARGNAAMEFEFSVLSVVNNSSVINAGCFALASDNIPGKQTVVYDSDEKIVMNRILRKGCEFWFTRNESHQLILEGADNVDGVETYRQFTVFEPDVEVALRPSIRAVDMTVLLSRVKIRKLKHFTSRRGGTLGERTISEVHHD